MTLCHVHAVPEEWHGVTSADRYQVSSRGRFRSLDGLSANGRQLKGVVFKPVTSKDNPYPTVKYTLNTGRQTSPRPVHQIVLEEFAGPCPEGMEASHLDDIPTHNCRENLIWDTQDGNRRVRMELHPAAPKPPPRMCIMCKINPVTRGGKRCHECVVDLGVTAAKWIAGGMSVRDACELLDYPSAEGLMRLAAKYGGYDVPSLPGDQVLARLGGHAERPPGWLRTVTARLARRAS